MNVMVPVRVWPSLNLIGKEGPEKENCAAEMVSLDIVILRLLSFVIVTLCEALADPTGWLPKLMDDGLTLTLALATVPKANTIMAIAAVA